MKRKPLIGLAQADIKAQLEKMYESTMSEIDIVDSTKSRLEPLVIRSWDYPLNYNPFSSTKKKRNSNYTPKKRRK
jgi:hypothetical protein